MAMAVAQIIKTCTYGNVMKTTLINIGEKSMLVVALIS